MSDSAESHSISPAEMKRAWAVVTWAGVLGSIYYLICVFDAPRIKFLVELGATPFHFGMIAGIGSFALAFQVVGALISRRLSRRKPLWMTLTIVHRLIFLGVPAAPLFFESSENRLWWILAVIFLHDALAQTGVPLWLSWMADLVPRSSLNRHWATRQRFITAVNIGAKLGVAFFFYYFEVSGRVILGYALLTGLAVVLGVIDIAMFAAVPEPPHEPPESMRFRDLVVEPLRDPDFRRFLSFMAWWHFSIFIAAPFFGPYMIDELKLSVMTVQILGAAAALGVVLASRYWGLVADVYGIRPVLQLMSIGKVFTPLVFLAVPALPAVGVPFLLAVMFVDGMLNAGMMLAIQGALLKLTPRRNRTMYIAVVHFLSIGIFGGIAPVLSGKLIETAQPLIGSDWGIWRITGYHAAFALSALLRLGSFALASRIRETPEFGLRSVLGQIDFWKSIRATRLVYAVQESDNAGERRLAARRLGRLRHPIALGGLIAALRDESREVREAAAHALGKIGTADAAAPLIEALSDPALEIQSPAARALGRIGGAESLRALLANLRNLDSEALDETIDSLARIGHWSAILPLVCLLDVVENPDRRERIVRALARLAQLEAAETMSLLHERRPVEQPYLR